MTPTSAAPYRLVKSWRTGDVFLLTVPSVKDERLGLICIWGGIFRGIFTK